MSGNDNNEGDKKVKELIDAATRAELERWFGLPSFQQLADEGRAPPPPEDPETAAIRKRRADAIAAIDPALVESHRRRVEPPDDLLKFKPSLQLRVNPDLGMLDLRMIARQHTIAEPREVEIPQGLEDDLRERTPQALLRDLHRPEHMFDKLFEVVDVVAERRVDLTAVIAEAMTPRTVTLAEASPFQEACALLVELRDQRHRPWIEIKMPNRRVTE